MHATAPPLRTAARRNLQLILTAFVALVLTAAFLPFTASPAHASAVIPDVPFNTNVGNGLDDPVHASALQPDGKILIVGMFTTPANGLARINADGTPDTAFNANVGTTLDGLVDAVAVQADGSIVVGGAFTSPANSLARFNPDGTPDTAFNTAIGTTLDGLVDALAVQSDGRIVVGGGFLAPSSNLARFTSDGATDDAFNAAIGTTIDGQVRAVALLADGALLVGGEFSTPARKFAKFSSSGTADSSFNTNVGTTINNRVRSVAVQDDGKIVVGGGFTSPANYLARFNSDGTPDDAFNASVGTSISGPFAAIRTVAVQDDGKIVAGGSFDAPAKYLARFVPVNAPEAPTGLQATPGYRQALIAFTAGADGGAPITNYEYTTDDGATWMPFDPPVTTSPVPVTGLANGIENQVKLRAVNVAGTGAASESVVVTPQGALFAALDPPIRVFDSRPSHGGGGALTPGVPVSVDVRAPVDAVAVAYNVTLVDTVDAGHLSVGPAGADLSGTSTVNWFGSGQRWANAYVSALGDGGQIQVLARGGATQVVIDVTGFFLENTAVVPASEQAVSAANGVKGSVFVPVDPARVYDSRVGDDPIAADESRTVDVSTMVPVGATGVVYTLTVTQTTDAGHLAVGLPGQAKPATSVINWFATGQSIANTATGALDANLALDVFAGGGPTQFVVDVVGYYAPNATGGLRFTAIDPARAYDSRDGDGPITGGQSRTTGVLPTSGTVPAGVGAVAFNLTEADTIDRGHLRVAPGGAPLPTVSTLNWFSTGMRLANGSVVGVTGDQMTTFARGQATEYVVDIAGYYN